MIGHNCSIGENNLLCSQVGIAGSSETGKYVVMAGQVGVADHLSIGDHTLVGAQAGLMHDVEPNQVSFWLSSQTQTRRNAAVGQSSQIARDAKTVEAAFERMLPN